MEIVLLDFVKFETVIREHVKHVSHILCECLIALTEHVLNTGSVNQNSQQLYSYKKISKNTL